MMVMSLWLAFGATFTALLFIASQKKMLVLGYALTQGRKGSLSATAQHRT